MLNITWLMVTDVYYIPICCFCRQPRCSCQVATVVGPHKSFGNQTWQRGKPPKTLRCLMGKSYMWKCPLPCLNIYWWICKGVIFEQPYSLSSSFPQIKLHTLYPCMFADTIRSHPDSASSQPAPGKYFGFLCSASAFSGILQCKEVERIPVRYFFKMVKIWPYCFVVVAVGGFRRFDRWAFWGDRLNPQI